MSLVTFKRRGPYGSESMVVASRITHWKPFSTSFGTEGTVVYLDTGKEVVVGDMPWEVETLVRVALSEKAAS